MRLQVLLRIFIFCSFLSFSGMISGDGEPTVHIIKKDPTSSTASDGSLAVSITGGIAPYTIYFTSTTLPGKIYHESTIALEGLKPGNYQFTIQDSKGHIVNKSIELQHR